MHIGFLCSEYPPGKYGGIGTFTQTMARALVQRGHRVTVMGVYRHRQGIEDDQGVTVVRLLHSNVPRFGFWLDARTLQRCIKQIHHTNPLSILEAQENGLALIGSVQCGHSVIRMHGGHHFFAVTLGRRPQPLKSWSERRSFRQAKSFCAVSRYVAEVTRQQLRMGNRSITILPNPVDVEKFQPKPQVTPIRGRMLFVGTVTEKKGVRQLIQAVPSIVAVVPSAHLQVIGRDSILPDSGGSFTQHLRSLLPVELQKRVEFSNHIENTQLPDHLAEAELAVFPSHMEAQGIAPIESMAMGKATIFSRTGPGKEVIEDGVTGLLCDPYDPNSIASCAVKLLQDAPLREQLGQNARTKVENDFAVARLVERNLEFYRQCLR